MTVRQAAAKYLSEYCPTASLRRAGQALEHFMPWIGDTDITLVHDGLLNGYRAKRREDGAAAGTMNQELSQLTRVHKLASRVWRHDNGRPFLDTAPLFTREAGDLVYKPYPLSWDEQRRMFSQLSAHLAEMALFAVNTGTRQEEFCALEWSWKVNVPEIGSYVFVLPSSVTKTRTERVLVLNSVARRIVDARAGKHPEFVFTTAAGDERIGRINNGGWTLARERAGLPTLRVHDLRHTFGHRLRSAGVDVEDRADLLGHAAGRMTTHYSAPDIARLLASAERVVEERPSTVLRAVSR